MGWFVDATQEVIPRLPVDVTEGQIKRTHNVSVEAFTVEHLGDVVDARRIHRCNHGLFVDVAHQRDLALDADRHGAVRTQHKRIRLNTDAAKCCDRVLRWFGLEFTRWTDVRQE